MSLSSNHTLRRIPVEKKLSRNLFFVSVGLFVLAGILIALAGISVDPTTKVVTVANTSLQLAGFGAYSIGAIIGIVASIGALVKLAKLGRWGWFVGVLLTGIGFLIYIFAGPTEKRV